MKQLSLDQIEQMIRMEELMGNISGEKKSTSILKVTGLDRISKMVTIEHFQEIKEAYVKLKETFRFVQ